jgi:hypothetical protein
MARPTKYRKEYPALLEKILSNGGFNCTFCKEVGIGEEAFYNWVKRHDEFSKALKKGKQASKAIFMEKLASAAWDTETHKVNNGLISLLAVNVHGLSTGKEKAAENTETGESFNVSITVRPKVE